MDHSILIVWEEKEEKDLLHIREKKKYKKWRKGREKERCNNIIHQMLIVCLDGMKERKEKEKRKKEGNRKEGKI